MTGIVHRAPPEDSLLAAFGGPGDYRDCFCLDTQGTVSLEAFIEAFYCSMAFRPERLVLGIIGRGASNADARALARSEEHGIGVWKVAERTRTQILLHSEGTGTASWLAVGRADNPTQTRLFFGSWVGSLDQSGWRFVERLHHWYSRVLLSGAARRLG